MKLKKWLVVAVAALSVTAGASKVCAQNRNFDPQQFQQMFMDRVREQMDVKNDDEWKAIQPRIEKVMEARRQVGVGGMGMGMMFGRRNRAGGDNSGTDNNNNDQRQRFRQMFQPSPEAEALQKAIESKAPAAEIKTALEKYRASVKEKQASLEKAQADLKKVLSVQQEAIAVMMGLLS